MERKEAVNKDHRSVYSHHPLSNGLEHPFFTMGKSIYNNSAEQRVIATKLKSEFKKHLLGPRALNHNEFKNSDAFKKFFPQFRALIADSVRSEPKSLVTGSMPKCPRSNLLYDRFEKKVLDVGCGDGKRIRNFDLEFETIDNLEAPLDDNGDKFTDHTVGLFESSTEKVISSLNVISNNENIDAFKDSDGLHIFPDVKNLAKNGYAIQHGNFYLTRAKEIEYKDYEVDLPSVPINQGYMCANTYRERQIDIELESIVKGKSVNSIGERVMAIRDVDPETITVKENGDLYRLSLNNGKGVLLSRDGTGFGVTSNFDESFIAIFEYLEETFKLLRIDLYREFKPFHGSNLINYFLERVNLHIGGFPIIPLRHISMEQALNDPDVEGIVFRENRQGELVDRLVKKRESIDVSFKDLAVFRKLLDRNDYALDMPIDPENKTMEFQLFVDGEHKSYRFYKYRRKVKGDVINSDTISGIMARVTLEVLAQNQIE